MKTFFREKGRNFIQTSYHLRTVDRTMFIQHQHDKTPLKQCGCMCVCGVQIITTWRDVATLHQQVSLLYNCEYNKTLCYCRGLWDARLPVEILQLRNIRFEKYCNRQMTLKYIHPRSSQLLLSDKPYITSCQWPVVTMTLAPFSRCYHLWSKYDCLWP